MEDRFRPLVNRGEGAVLDIARDVCKATGTVGGLAQPNPLNYSSGCPAQASLGRGFRERELSA
jgi:hypothetical protein